MVFDCKNVNCGVAIFYRRQEQDCCSHTSTFRFLEGICLRADAFRKAVMVGLEKKLTLYGFNNLTKTLSFNIFDVCYAKSEREKQDYIRYIDEQYNSERLTNILCDVTEMIGAAVLNISRQDYEPQGASVNVLIAEGSVAPESIDPSCNQGDGFLQRRDIHAHLDKSHVTVHTFPESHPDNEVTTFRVDIDVSTSIQILSPLIIVSAALPEMFPARSALWIRKWLRSRILSAKKFSCGMMHRM